MKKVEFDTDEKPHKKSIRRDSINFSPKPALKSKVNREKDIEIVIDQNEMDLCVEYEPGQELLIYDIFFNQSIYLNIIYLHDHKITIYLKVY